MRPPAIGEVSVPETGDATTRDTAWNTAAIRELLIAAFGDEELTTLCFDRFRPVHEQFSTDMSKVDKIQRLVEHCDRHNQMDELLRLIAERNPSQYELFAARL